MKVAAIPMRMVGPVHIQSDWVQGDVQIPMATFESPVWYATSRGAKVSRKIGGVHATLVQDSMSRSVILQAPHVGEAARVAQDVQMRRAELEAVVTKSSRFAHFLELHTQIVGDLLYVRFSLSTGDAAGHNMVTQAAEHLLQWMLQQYSSLRYVSISGNVCADKKVSAVNGLLGRGKYVVVEAVIPEAVCQAYLRTTPEQVVSLHEKKNLLGSVLAGSVRSANAHFANMLLATYLATGQDAANIVEGSQGVTFAEVRAQDLYFSVTLPNIIVGTVGSGKDIPFVVDNLRQLGCLDARAPGDNAKRLAVVIAAAVWCGELSLLAAQTNPGELVRSHVALERKL